jgi:hypothetical protein
MLFKASRNSRLRWTRSSTSVDLLFWLRAKDRAFQFDVLSAQSRDLILKTLHALKQFSQGLIRPNATHV